MAKPQPTRLTAADALRDAEAALERERDKLYDAFETVDRALAELRKLSGLTDPAAPYLPTRGAFRYAALGQTRDVIDVILMYLDQTGKAHTARELAEEIVSGGFYERRGLGRKKNPAGPGGPGSAETQVLKSIDYHCRTIEEKQRLYKGQRVKIQPPKLRKLLVPGTHPNDSRELVGRAEWPDEKFR